MNIEEIKERVELRAHMKTLCNNPNMLTNWVGSINYNNAEDDVIYLLSIIEQAESKCKEIETATKYLQHIPIFGLVYSLAGEALKSIHGVRE